MPSSLNDNSHSRSFDLRPMLREWASRFTQDANLRERIVDATIFKVADAPERLSGSSIRRSLYKIVVRTAQETVASIDRRKGPLDVEMYPDGEFYVVRLADGQKSEEMKFISERSARKYLRTLKRRSVITRKAKPN
ncbi:DNA-directed RNA polymerase specialized sigma24 family protein [Rhizobium wenxiniae]|uniref:DNA-directed RNA polymerase specialized sigma24 family protein n=1 Tax=Rhizobium wenxiniae TaxID=1737357 RepID=A0A7W9YBL3_9HYPH|nr:hypothetical protein [Rhizobium wenxiniae]MBB6165599.1 DNA-directed RNA polymerase specialized sigma24 family protein [Rhizobium wenxiniae]